MAIHCGWSFGAIWLVIACNLVLRAWARDRCVWAQGVLVCHANPKGAANIELKLIDYDGGTFFDPDDDMGFDISNEDGSFRIRGCGGDMFPWNDPDPFLEIFHNCTTSGYFEVYKTDIVKVFAPEILDLGIIDLDEPPPLDR